MKFANLYEAYVSTIESGSGRNLLIVKGGPTPHTPPPLDPPVIPVRLFFLFQVTWSVNFVSKTKQQHQTTATTTILISNPLQIHPMVATRIRRYIRCECVCWWRTADTTRVCLERQVTCCPQPIGQNAKFIKISKVNVPT